MEPSLKKLAALSRWICILFREFKSQRKTEMNLKIYTLVIFSVTMLTACTGNFGRDFNANMKSIGKFFAAETSSDERRARKLPPPGKDWKTVRNSKPNGTDFNAFLSRDYKSLMLFEGDEMFDAISAHMYARRSLDAASGTTMAPLKPEEFRFISKANLSSLQRARTKIADFFGKGSKKKFPMLSARLQSSFDCWVEEQSEGHQPDMIARCRDEFVEASRKLRKAMTAPPVVAAPPRIAMKRPAPPKPTFKESYVVYFNLNSTVLNSAARNTLAEVIRALKAQNAGASIVGHTDTLGTKKYNLSLSQKRAKAVAGALLNAGIRPAVLTTVGRGEADLAASTRDNVNEPKNRRAVINIR